MRQLLSRIRRRHLISRDGWSCVVALAGWWAVRTPHRWATSPRRPRRTGSSARTTARWRTCPSPTGRWTSGPGTASCGCTTSRARSPTPRRCCCSRAPSRHRRCGPTTCPSLLRLRSVYAVDLLGEPGLSVQQRPISTPRDHAQWLHDMLLALPEPQVHLVGLSIGGWTAMNLVVHRPEKLASVTLIEPVRVYAELSFGAIVRSVPGQRALAAEVVPGRLRELDGQRRAGRGRPGRPDDRGRHADLRQQEVRADPSHREAARRRAGSRPW